MNLIPAYNKRYASKEEAQADWDNGKDFKILDGPYCSIRDKDEMLDEVFFLHIFWQYPTGRDAIVIESDNDPYETDSVYGHSSNI